MHHISQHVQSKHKSKANSERASILEEIIREINLERVGTNYPQIKQKHQVLKFAMKLSHIPTKDLYYLKSEAFDYQRRSGSFSKYVFGAIKAKRM